MKLNEVFGKSAVKKERRSGKPDTRTDKVDRRAAAAIEKVRAKEKAENLALRKAKMQDPDTKTMSPIEAGEKNHKPEKK